MFSALRLKRAVFIWKVGVMGYIVLDKTEWVLDLAKEMVAQTISIEEMEKIRVWRNAQTSVLRQNRETSVEEQESYFRESILPDQGSSSPTNILFTLWSRGELFGYGGLVHINWDFGEAEISFLVRPDWNRLEIFSTSFLLFQQFLEGLCARSLGISTLTAETFDVLERQLVIALLEQSGFELVGSRQGHYIKEGFPVKSLNHKKRCKK